MYSWNFSTICMILQGKRDPFKADKQASESFHTLEPCESRGFPACSLIDQWSESILFFQNQIFFQNQMPFNLHLIVSSVTSQNLYPVSVIL